MGIPLLAFPTEADVISVHMFAWLQVASRFGLGVILIALVGLDRHASTVFLDENYQYTGSRIWRLATQSWV